MALSQADMAHSIIIGKTMLFHRQFADMMTHDKVLTMFNDDALFQGYATWPEGNALSGAFVRNVATFSA